MGVVAVGPDFLDGEVVVALCDNVGVDGETRGGRRRVGERELGLGAERLVERGAVRERDDERRSVTDVTTRAALVGRTDGSARFVGLEG